MKRIIPLLYILAMLMLVECQNQRSHWEMAEEFLDDLYNEDSVKCLNSIFVKSDSKENEALQNKEQIGKCIGFLKNHPKPVFKGFNNLLIKLLQV